MNKIESYLKTSEEMIEIRDKAIKIIKETKGISEKEVAEFILNEYKKKGLIPPKDKKEPKVIVAFGKNTSEVHHFPDKTKLKEGPIMMDIFAKHKNGCFVDLTFMLYKGKIKREFKEKFDLFIKARDEGLKFIERCMKKKYFPTLFEIDAVVRGYFSLRYVGNKFNHGIGHSMGKNVHDGDKIEYYEKIRINRPYAFEPGLYFKNKFGIRLENNFFIDKKLKIHFSGLQKKIIMI